MGRLSGKVALITGGGQGIGLGIARLFAAEGADLAITGRDAAKLKGVVPELEALGAKVVVSAGDASVRANADAAVEAAVKALGRLDVLVNNAQTVAPIAPLESLTEAQIRTVIDTGFYATIWHMTAALPHLKATKGAIINMGSREGVLGGAGMAVYGAGKEAIRGLSRSAAREWGQYGIRINTINPAALTVAAQDYFKAHPEMEAFHLKEIPLGRFGDPDTDIARVALFLASEDGLYLTGQTLNADGGMVML